MKIERRTLNSLRRRGKDRLTKERRSWNMSRIKGKNTSPELIVRRLLHKMGYRFRLHVRIPLPDTQPSTKIPQPRRSVSVDIVLPKYKTAISFTASSRLASEV